MASVNALNGNANKRKADDVVDSTGPAVATVTAGR